MVLFKIGNESFLKYGLGIKGNQLMLYFHLEDQYPPNYTAAEWVGSIAKNELHWPRINDFEMGHGI